MSDVLIERRSEARGSFPLLAEMIVERGTRDDWHLLHDLHYKAEGTPAAARYWRLVLHGRTIGVIVTASPKLLLKERHQAFPKLKPGGDETKKTNTYRAQFLNRNFRVISRFVLDTMFRGVGAAYRFQNLASRMEGVQFMEIQSSMSKYNLFGQKAGFSFVQPSNSNKYDVGIKFFRSTYLSNPGDHEEILRELDAMEPAVREHVIAKTRSFYYRHSALEKTGKNRDRGTSRVDAMPVPDLIRNLQQMTLASPLYGVYRNPDVGRELPERLPLTAFDNQGPKEPLKLELL